MRNLLSALLFCLMCSLAVAQTSYLCVADKATGFYLNKSKNSWDATAFDTKDSKYLLYLKESKWEWKNFGEQFPFGTCKQINENGDVRCDGFGTVLFSPKNLRYLLTYLPGYVFEHAQKSDTPYMEIGKCTRM